MVMTIYFTRETTLEVNTLDCLRLLNLYTDGMVTLSVNNSASDRTIYDVTSALRLLGNVMATDKSDYDTEDKRLYYLLNSPLKIILGSSFGDKTSSLLNTCQTRDLLREIPCALTPGDRMSLSTGDDTIINDDLVIDMEAFGGKFLPDLVFVNGILTPSEMIKNKLWLTNGYAFLQRHPLAQDILAIDFKPLGDVITSPLISSNVKFSSVKENVINLDTRDFKNLNGIDLRKYLVVPFIAGRMFYPSSVARVFKTTVEIDLNNLQYKDLILDNPKFGLYGQEEFSNPSLKNFDETIFELGEGSLTFPTGTLSDMSKFAFSLGTVLLLLPAHAKVVEERSFDIEYKSFKRNNHPKSDCGFFFFNGYLYTNHVIFMGDGTKDVYHQLPNQFQKRFSLSNDPLGKFDWNLDSAIKELKPSPMSKIMTIENIGRTFSI